MSQLQFSANPTYLILFAVIALVAASLLYYRDQRWMDKPVWISLALASIRFLAFFGLLSLLLSPFISYMQEKEEQPIVIAAIDNSESMRLTQTADSAAFMQEWKSLRSGWKTAELIPLLLGNTVSPLDSVTYREQQSNLSSLFDAIQTDYAGRTIGGVILASDGLYNIGQHPGYHSALRQAPVFTIPLGDTSFRRDIRVKQLFHNDLAYVGDRFTIQADIEASELAGTSVEVQLLHRKKDKNQRIATKEIQINQASFFTTLDFVVEAKEKGLQRYTVAIRPIADEISQINNRKSCYVNQIDGRQSVLLLGGQPHPDIGALRFMLARLDNYEVDVHIITPKEKLPNLSDYDVLVLHQIPSRKVPKAISNQIAASNTPKLYITGLATDVPAFNDIQDFLHINVRNNQPNVVDAAFNESFNVFSFPEDIAQDFAYYPPLETFFGDIKPKGRVRPIFYQKIGDVPTNYPLIALAEEGGKRAGFILGEGVWRWRLYNFAKKENHEQMELLIDQLVRYVAVKDDKRKFRVVPNAQLFDENENIRVRAELYNDNYELVNDVDVNLLITDENGQDYSFLFSKEQNFYQLDAGFLPAGTYTYRASTNRNGSSYQSTGSFTVKAIQLEMYQTRANWNILRQVAEKSGGAFVPISQMSSIPSLMQEKNLLKPIIYSSTRTRSMMHVKWVFWLLFALLATEWIARRLAGTY